MSNMAIALVFSVALGWFLLTVCLLPHAHAQYTQTHYECFNGDLYKYNDDLKMYIGTNEKCLTVSKD